MHKLATYENDSDFIYIYINLALKIKMVLLVLLPKIKWHIEEHSIFILNIFV